MDRTTRMTLVPASQLAGLALAIERIGGSAAKGKGHDIIAQTGEVEPTYGDVVDLAEDAGTFDLALRKANADLPAGKVGRVRLLVQKFDLDTPVCAHCGDLAVDVVGGEALVRSAGQACPGCGEYLEASEAAKPYAAWTTGGTVAPTISYDFDTVPGDRIPLSDAAVRKEVAVDPALDALLAAEGVSSTQFLLWLFHGPEKARFTRAPRKALAVLANPLAETFTPNVTRNWVKAAKGFRVVATPADVSPTDSAGWNFATTKDWAVRYGSRCTTGTSLAMLFEDLGRQLVSDALSSLSSTKGIIRNIPEGKGLSGFAHDLAETLSRHGLADSSQVYRTLAHAAPARAGDVLAVARICGASITQADLTGQPEAVDRDRLVNALKRILPAQFGEIEFRMGVPAGILPGSSAPQATRAIELLRWAETANRVDDLVRLTRDKAPALL